MALSLVEIHILAQERLRKLISRLVEAIWRSLGGYDEPDASRFIEQTVPVIQAGQRQSIALTEAYVARVLERPSIGVDIDTAQIRNGTPPEEVYHRPFVDYWSALAVGTEWQDAVDKGMNRATSTAEMDIQLASRAAFQAIQDADDNIFGYRRKTDGDACEFCRLVEGAYVKRADAFPLHNHCGCSLEPLTEVHDRAVYLPDGTKIRDFQHGPLLDHSPIPEEVAVKEHGELGPVLVDPAHHWTGPRAVAA